MNDQLRRFLAARARALVADGLEPTEAASRVREAASRFALSPLALNGLPAGQPIGRHPAPQDTRKPSIPGAGRTGRAARRGP